MKITKLKIRNLFGIRCFDSDGKDIELNGRKGVGKTSIIDAIKYALTNKSDRDYIITQGEQEGEVLIETDTGLRVNRKTRTEKADYKSIKQGVEKDEKTESFLREIFTELQLNPVEFAAMDSKEQNRIILDLIEFKWNMGWIKDQFGEIPPEINYDQNILCILHDIQAEEGFYFLKRQDLNREMRNKQSFIAEIGSALPEAYSASHWQAVNLGDLYKKIEKIRSDNEWIEKAKRAVAGRDNKVRSFQADYEIDKSAIDKDTSHTRTNLEKQIAEAQSRIKAMKKDLETLEEKKASRLKMAKKDYESKVAAFDGEVKQYEDLAKKETTGYADLQAEAENAEKMKSFINEYNRMLELEKDVVNLRGEAESLTAKIEKARTLPGEILANANIPIEGLEIKDGVPLIHGRPVSNLSEGECLELCVDVAVQREGSLKLLLIDGIEKLPTQDRTRMYKKLKAKGVQFVSTRVTDDDKLTVVEL